MSTEVASTQIDRERVKELTARESKRLDEATQNSKRMFERARGRRPSDYERHHHVGENDDVPQRDYGEGLVDFHSDP